MGYQFMKKTKQESDRERKQKERRQKTFVSQGYHGQKTFTIPSRYHYIGKEALRECHYLEKLVIPGTIKEIERKAFENCVNLREVILEEGIESLDWYLFAGCEKLHHIIVPDSVRSVDSYTFKKIPNLKVPVRNASGTRYIYYPPNLGEPRVTIPSGVRVIQKDAFYNCTFLKEVVFSDTLECIEGNAFYNTSLERLVIPECVTCVAPFAFTQCWQLKQVEIRCPMSAIQSRAFQNCLRLRFPYESPAQYMECLRVQGKSLFRIPGDLNLPEEGHGTDPVFLECTAGCLMGEQKAMEQMADYFHRKREGHPFYQAAEHFWRLRLYYHGNEEAKQWLFDWLDANHDTQMEIAASALRPGGDGAVLHALGFLFFDPKRSYDVQLPDSSGVVEVTAYVGEDDPDEDGFGRENYYDWWYMTENLAMVPDAHCIRSCSNREKHNHEEEFHALHDFVAEMWKKHPERVEWGIQKIIRKKTDDAGKPK